MLCHQGKPVLNCVHIAGVTWFESRYRPPFLSIKFKGLDIALRINVSSGNLRGTFLRFHRSQPHPGRLPLVNSTPAFFG